VVCQRHSKFNTRLSKSLNLTCLLWYQC